MDIILVICAIILIPSVICLFISWHKEKVDEQKLVAQRNLVIEISKMVDWPVEDIIQSLENAFNGLAESYDTKEGFMGYQLPPEELTKLLLSKFRQLKAKIALKNNIPELKTNLSESIETLREYMLKLIREDKNARKYLKSSRRALASLFESSVDFYDDPVSFCRLDLTDLEKEYTWVFEKTPLTLFDAIVFSRIKNRNRLKEANTVIEEVARTMEELSETQTAVRTAREELEKLSEFIVKQKIPLAVIGVDTDKVLIELIAYIISNRTQLSAIGMDVDKVLKDSKGFIQSYSTQLLEKGIDVDKVLL